MSKSVYPKEEIKKDSNLLDNYLSKEKISFDRKKLIYENDNYPVDKIPPIGNNMAEYSIDENSIDEMSILNKILLEEKTSEKESIEIELYKNEIAKENENEIEIMKTSLNGGVAERDDIHKKQKITADRNPILEERYPKKEAEMNDLYDTSGNTLGRIIWSEKREEIISKTQPDAIKILNYLDENGIYNNITDILVSSSMDIYTSKFDFFIENESYYEISTGWLLLGEKSIKIDERNKKRMIIDAYVKEKNLSAVGIADDQESMNIINREESQKNIDALNILIEKIFGNNKIFNNKIYQNIKSQERPRENQEKYSEIKLKYSKEDMNIIDIRDFSKNSFKLVTRARTNKNPIVMQKNLLLNSRFLMTKKVVLENKEVPQTNNERQWNFIFDKDKMILSYLKRVINHRENLFYTLANVRVKHQMKLKNYGESPTKRKEMEKLAVTKMAYEIYAKSKIIEVPKYSNTYDLLKENNELIKEISKENELSNNRENFENLERKLVKEIDFPMVVEKKSQILAYKFYENIKTIEKKSQLAMEGAIIFDINVEKKPSKIKNMIMEMSGKESEKKDEHIGRRYKYVF